MFLRSSNFLTLPACQFLSNLQFLILAKRLRRTRLLLFLGPLLILLLKSPKLLYPTNPLFPLRPLPVEPRFPFTSQPLTLGLRRQPNLPVRFPEALTGFAGRAKPLFDQGVTPSRGPLTSLLCLGGLRTNFLDGWISPLHPLPPCLPPQHLLPHQPHPLTIPWGTGSNPLNTSPAESALSSPRQTSEGRSNVINGISRFTPRVVPKFEMDRSDFPSWFNNHDRLTTILDVAGGDLWKKLIYLWLRQERRLAFGLNEAIVG